LLFNNQEGAFEEIKKISVNEDPLSVAAADLDGDSDFDLAVGYRRNRLISVLINNGDGTFQDSQQYLVAGTAGNDRLSVGDLNGDAYPDLAANHFPGRKISILMNNGDGTFGEALDYEAEFGPRYITIADLNGDTYADLVVPSESGMMSVYFNNGDGSFQERVVYDIGGTPFLAAAVDLDQDTALDLLVSPSGRGMSVFLNDGAGTFQLTEDYYFGGVLPWYFVVTDLDRDGRREVVATNSSGDSSVYVLPIETGLLKFR